MIVLIIAIVLFVGACAFFCSRRLLDFYKVDVKSRLGITLNIVLTVLITAGCANMRSISALILLHLLLVFGISDITRFLVRKLWKERTKYKFYRVCRFLCRSGIVAVVVTAVAFTYGYLNMQNIVRTDYILTSDKIASDYTVVLITDTHYDTVQSPSILKEKIAEINALEADIIVLGGDIVEEGTSKQSMQEVFALFGSLDAKYGVYFVYGNHDKQTYSRDRAFTEEELYRAIISSGIIVLEDVAIELGDELVLAGRADSGWGDNSGRLSSEAILSGMGRSKYIIMADHQPIDAEENAKQGVDLQISGHTHAGQIWPLPLFTALAGVLNYGCYNIDGCRVIVSSGFTGWGYPIRTSGHCEYAVINIQSSR